MTKKKQSKTKATTHFEQTPVAVVKKIADRHPSETKDAGPDNVIVERAYGKTEPYSMSPTWVWRGIDRRSPHRPSR